MWSRRCGGSNKAMDILERAKRYLERMDPSVSGSNGHDRLFAAACALVQGFDLSDGEAMELLERDFNPRCSPAWSERELRHKVSQARKNAGAKERGYLLGNARRESRGRGDRRPAGGEGAVESVRPEKRTPFDPAALARMQTAGFSPDERWLAGISPVDPRGVDAAGFLDAIFEPGEKTLLFTSYFSQGEFGHVAGDPGTTYALPQRPHAQARPVEVEIPRTGREGAWFLPVPLDGRWHPTGSANARGEPVVSRRSGHSVRAWRHMLLESDEASDDQWLALLAQLPLPISAVYTSGGRSIHALVKVDTQSKGQFDAFRDRVSPLLAKLGADAAAFSGVRLTRLPGVMREGKMAGKSYQRFPEPRLQRLLYLNPKPEVRALRTLHLRRKISE